jgi:predicted metal-dependent phosphoesterase TrpH
LHIHTRRYSRGCSILEPREMVAQAIHKGLDGIAITEHDHLWSKREISELKKTPSSDSLVILRGKEIITPGGHVLVFNYNGEIPGKDSLETLTEKVRQAGGATVLAHPFRFARLLNDPQEKIKMIFSWFDAIEIMTPNHSAEEIGIGLQWVQAWGMAATGSSDSHDRQSVGAYLTAFPKSIHTEEDLAQALREHFCRPVKP